MCKLLVEIFGDQRYGNIVIQIINALQYAIINNCKIIEFTTNCDLFSKDFVKIDGGSKCTCDKILVKDDFFDIKIKDCPITEKEIVNKYLKPMLLIDTNSSEDLSNVLVIYIRDSLSYSGSKHPFYYLQPPLAFYKMVVDLKDWSKIILVGQKGNPCYKALLNTYPNIIDQSGTAFDNMQLMCQAQNLVLGYGSFGTCAVRLSSNIINVYIPTYANYGAEKYCENVICIDLPGYKFTGKANLKQNMLFYKIPKDMLS